DQETGLCWVRFRYFDADVGRWCSPDPLGIVGGRNLGAFERAPTTAADPFGLSCRRVVAVDTDALIKWKQTKKLLRPDDDVIVTPNVARELKERLPTPISDLDACVASRGARLAEPDVGTAV